MGDDDPMNTRAICWIGGMFLTMAGIFLGLRHVVRANSFESEGRFQMPLPPHAEGRIVRCAAVDYDAFSPDDFRGELLK